MSTVSVVIPAFNRAGSVGRAIRSVVGQDHRDLEVIVVDDGSTDGTGGVAREYGRLDTRVLVVAHEARRGAQAARNTGIRAARGAWIAFLDSDDEWLADSVSVRLDRAAEDGTDVVHSECCVETSPGGERKAFGVRPLSGTVYEELLRNPGPVFPGLLAKASAFERINGLDEDIASYQEWDTAIRLARHFPFAFVAAPTFVYHRHDGETISGDRLRQARGYEQVFTKHRADVVRLLGRGALAQHYENAALLYRKAGETADFRRCLREAVRHGTIGRSQMRRLALLLGMGGSVQAG